MEEEITVNEEIKEVKTYNQMIAELEKRYAEIYDSYAETIDFCEKNKERVRFDETIIAEYNSLSADIAIIWLIKEDDWKIAQPKKFKTIHTHFFKHIDSVIVVDKYMIENNIIGDIMILDSMISDSVIDNSNFSHILESDTFKINLENVEFEIKAKHSALKCALKYC